eukprot:1159684-Pelagomonas_calceolata.AAC.4
MHCCGAWHDPWPYRGAFAYKQRIYTSGSIEQVITTHHSCSAYSLHTPLIRLQQSGVHVPPFLTALIPNSSLLSTPILPVLNSHSPYTHPRARAYRQKKVTMLSCCAAAAAAAVAAMADPFAPPATLCTGTQAHMH